MMSKKAVCMLLYCMLWFHLNVRCMLKFLVNEPRPQAPQLGRTSKCQRFVASIQILSACYKTLVVHFTGLLQLVKKLQQGFQLNYVATSLLKPGLLKLVTCHTGLLQLVETTFSEPVDDMFQQSLNLHQVC